MFMGMWKRSYLMLAYMVDGLRLVVNGGGKRAGSYVQAVSFPRWRACWMAEIVFLRSGFICMPDETFSQE